MYAAQKKTLLNVPSVGYTLLPTDFVRIHQIVGDDGELIPTTLLPVVEGTYRIINDTIYAEPNTYSLEYYYVPNRVKGLGDDLDVPLSMEAYIQQISLALFGNHPELAEQIVQQCSQTLLEEPEGTQELSNYLDRAVEEYSKRQAASGDMRLLKTMSITSGSTLPNDYIAMCGSVPVSITGKTITFYSDESMMPVRYFARLPYVTSYANTANLPYERDQELAICALAAIYALNNTSTTFRRT